MSATFLIELTCQTSLNWYYAREQGQNFFKYSYNFLNNAVNLHDGKINFFKILSDWVGSWAQISDFSQTKQTSKAFVVTLRAQAMLMQKLLEEGYENQ